MSGIIIIIIIIIMYIQWRIQKTHFEGGWCNNLSYNGREVKFISWHLLLFLLSVVGDTATIC